MCTQVVIVNQHLRQPPPQQQQMQPPPQLVIARPRGDGASPPGARSPQFPAIPPFVGAGASPLETPATSGQSQPQLRYHKQVSGVAYYFLAPGQTRSWRNARFGHVPSSECDGSRHGKPGGTALSKTLDWLCNGVHVLGIRWHHESKLMLTGNKHMM